MENSTVRLNEMTPVNSGEEWKKNISLFSSNNIIIRAKTKLAHFKEHWGPLSIKCAFNGEENYYSKDFRSKVDDSSFMIFNEGRIYGSFIESEKEVESFTIHFSPEFAQHCFHALFNDYQELIDNPFRIEKREVFFSEQLRFHDHRISPTLFEIRQLANKTDFLSLGHINELNLELLQILVDEQIQLNRSTNEIKALRHSTRKELKKRLTVGRDYIFYNYKSDISIDDIANVACMNKYHFIRQFKKAYDATPHQYVLRLRLQHAAGQLKLNQKSVTEICNEIGFCDLASFSKLFKRYYKFSPKDYKMNFNTSLKTSNW